MNAMPVLEVDGIVTRFGAQTIHDRLSFRVDRPQVVALIGGSGSGKSVLLREIIGLLRPTCGQRAPARHRHLEPPTRTRSPAVRRRFGMMFQDGALFSSLTSRENVATPLREHAACPRICSIRWCGCASRWRDLPPDAGAKMPSELSGGMRKRAAIARALALEPEVLFLDEPTSGLDPITARAFDKLLRFLCDDLGLTVFVVTHDLDTLLGIVDRVIVLARGTVIADGPVHEVMDVDDPWIASYFAVRRTVAARPQQGA